MGIGLVLVYHRITTVDSDPWALCVTPEHFAEHLQILAAHTRPVALGTFVEAVQNKSIRPRSVAITFDDGYADNLQQAAPLLDRHQIPATFFLSTGWIEERAEFWWDELENILLQLDDLPPILAITLDGTDHSWDLEAKVPVASPSWRAWEPAPTLRHKAYAELWSHLHLLDTSAREGVMTTIRSWAGVERTLRPTHGPLTTDDVVELSRFPNFHIGAHTVSHSALSGLTREEQQRELADNRQWLESLTGAPVKTFAYPFGKPVDFTDETVALLKELDFICACTTETTAAGDSVDLHRLPRIHVGDMDGKRFEGFLNHWLEDGVGTPARSSRIRGEARYQLGTTMSVPEDVLLGAKIDSPRPYTPFSAGAEIAGWALGTSEPVHSVGLLKDGEVIQSAPVEAYRNDVASAFPDTPSAAWSGFRFVIGDIEEKDLHGIQLGAILADGGKIPLATITDRKAFAAQSDLPLVCVVIPCYNHAHFLDQAIESVLAQSYSPVEIVVVDDGSVDNTSEVANRYPGVKCVRQENQGLPGARNSGLKSTSAPYVVFLDADDMLRPDALLDGVMFLEDHPRCAFVWGHHRLVNTVGAVIGMRDSPDNEDGGFEQLLKRNFVSMGATVMHRRAIVERAGGFDPSLQACEDYDLYLRIARNSPIGCHGQVVADYRQHKANMTKSSQLMLESAISVLARQKEFLRGESEQAAFREGLSFWRDYYGSELILGMDEKLTKSQLRSVAGDLFSLARYHPWGLLSAAKTVKRRFINRSEAPAGSGSGDDSSGLPRRLNPISDNWGFDRGTPIDRYYIESFLERQKDGVRGRVLEIGDNAYTKRFGQDNVKQSDVLNREDDIPGTTIIGDLTHAEEVPSDCFDCVILTQTLHLIYETRSALKTLHRILAPGGVLLLTVPGITRISQNEWGGSWYWSFTSNSMKRLFEEVFEPEMVEVEPHGNALTASAFLYGMATWELTQEELDFRHPNYEVIVAVRARKGVAS